MAPASNVFNTAGSIDARGNARVHVGDSHTHNRNEDPAEKRRRMRIDFLQGLRTCPYEERKDRNPTRATGTCEWFTSHERFRAWQDQESSLLWVSADLGCGKSVLSRYLVDDVLPASDDRITCYFFFKDDFDDQRGLPGALCCILHQLFNQEPQALSDSIIDTYEHEGQFLSTSAQSLFRLLIEAAANSTRDVVCIFDALDECSDSKPLTDTLRKLYFDAEGRGKSKLKFLITSRPYPQIRHEFATLPTIHLSGESEDEVNQISREIDIVVERRGQALASMRRLSDVQERSLRDALGKMKYCTYLWVHLAFADLEQARLLHEHALTEAIATLPTSVEEAYSKILSKSDNTKQVLKVLQMVVAAVRPLDLQEAAVALALDTGKHHTYADLMADVADAACLRQELRDLCGLFVVVIGERLYLLHQAAREFLVSKDPAVTSGRNWQYCVKPETANAVLADITMRFLLLLLTPQCLDHEAIYESYRYTAFFDYAASHWPEHYSQAESGPLTSEMLAMAMELCIMEHWWPAMGRFDFYPEYKLLRAQGMLVASYFGLASLIQPILQAYGKRPDLGPTLYRASICGHALFVKQLLKQYFEGGISNRRFFSRILPPTDITESIGNALRKAASFGHYQVVEVLLDHVRGTRALEEARIRAFMAASDVEIVKLFLQYGLSPDSRGPEGCSVLSEFASRGDLDGAEALIRHGAHINQGSTYLPLASAARGNHAKTMKLLISLGAQIEARDSQGRTALMHAVTGISIPVVELLLDHGAQTEARGNKGQTALMYAVVRFSLFSAELLLGRGAQIEAADYGERTALLHVIVASISGISAVKLLVERGAHVEARDKQGRTPLMAAAAACHHEAVDFLLTKGAQVAAKDHYGKTAGDWAGKKPHPGFYHDNALRRKAVVLHLLGKAVLVKSAPAPYKR